jgi:diguanylate cyclase (GGDEF)-like protein
MKILIADDSIVSRHLLEATLRKWGYEVLVATDGAEAWEILQRENAPPVAILDWVMPELTGPEVCRKVRWQQGQEPYTYILLLTSKNQKEDLIEGMDAGADDYLTKPFDQHELQVRLRSGTRIVHLQEELRRQATRDPLTGALNRSKTFEALERELSRGRREFSSVSVVMLDLDHFKKVNDTHGHLAGDQVLREASRRLRGSVRTYDFVGRYGGEEFLVVLPNCGLGDACNQANRLRAILADTPVTLPDGCILEVTASFGVAASNLNGDLESPEALIRQADEALYEAKRQGRNRVCWSSSFQPA